MNGNWIPWFFVIIEIYVFRDQITPKSCIMEIFFVIFDRIGNSAKGTNNYFVLWDSLQLLCLFPYAFAICFRVKGTNDMLWIYNSEIQSSYGWSWWNPEVFPDVVSLETNPIFKSPFLATSGFGRVAARRPGRWPGRLAGAAGWGASLFPRVMELQVQSKMVITAISHTTIVISVQDNASRYEADKDVSEMV